MARYNEDMFKEIITVYLPTPKGLTYVSSSAVRNLIDLSADFSSYVPKAIYDIAKKILEENNGK